MTYDRHRSPYRRPEKTQVDTTLACENGKGNVFSVATGVFNGILYESVFAVLDPDSPFDKIAGGLIMRDPRVVDVHVVRACVGTVHADMAAAERTSLNDGLYTNELLASYVVASEVDAPVQQAADVNVTRAIESLTGRRVPVSPDTPIVFSRGPEVVPFIVDDFTQIVHPSQFPGMQD